MSQRTHTRKFLGKTKGFESKEEQRREQKHLKSYLKGYNRFTFGRDSKGFPIWHKVLQLLTPLKTI